MANEPLRLFDAAHFGTNGNVTSYVSTIVTYLLSCTVSEIIGLIFAHNRKNPLFNALVWGKLLTSGWGNFGLKN